MDPDDANIGFWIAGAPYTFHGSSVVEKRRRFYIDQYSELDGIPSSETCSWVKNYFKYDSSPKTAYKSSKAILPMVMADGRIFYEMNRYVAPGFALQIPILNNTSILSTELSKYTNKYFEMSSLICTQMANRGGDLRWPEVIDLMDRCRPSSECDPCTLVGTKIAKSLIKIAALRIFADPEQSIMELPVNSIDAYNPSRKIGKFGMGFFSILYWLIDHPERSLVIHSYYEQNGTFTTYMTTVKEHKGALSFSLTTYPESKITKTGFRVVLEATRDPFSSENVTNFIKQFEKLRYASGARIVLSRNYLEWDTRKSEILGDPDSNNSVYCSVTNDHIIIEDFATGLGLENLFGSLFVPSISSKTIQLAERPLFGFENRTRMVKDYGKHKLLFLVGGIAIVMMEKPASGFETTSYIIDLPGNTRIPVSRDDIILSDETSAILRTNIATLFEEASVKGDVTDLQKLLQDYIDFTPNDANKILVRECLGDFFEKEKHRLVPEANKELYHAFQNQLGSKSPHFIASLTYDPESIERWFDENFEDRRTDIWYGMKVVFIRIDSNSRESFYIRDITNAGLISYLFIREDYKTRLGKSWIQIVTTSFFEVKLYPVSFQDSEKEYEKYKVVNLGKAVENVEKIIPDERIRGFYFAVLNKFESLQDRFVITKNQTDSWSSPTPLENLSRDLVMIYQSLPKTNFNNIVNVLLSKFSTFKGQQTYGAAKNKLFYGVPMRESLTSKAIMESIKASLYSKTLPFSDFYDPKVVEGILSHAKLDEFMTQHIICTIKAVSELPLTILSLFSKLSPVEILENASNRPTLFSFCEEAARQSLNLYEFTFLVEGAGVSFKYFTARKGEPSLPSYFMKSIVSHFLQRIRTRRLGQRQLVELYELWENAPPSPSQSVFVFMKKDSIESEMWIKNMTGVTFIPKSIDEGPVASKNGVLLSSIIRDLFTRKDQIFSDPKKLGDFFQNIEKEGSGGKLQIIEIAINEGTVKPFIDAVLTELVQNSIDAIREFKPPNQNIEVNLSAVNEGRKIILEFVDYVGLSSEAFVYIGIPFLSTKTPSELVTGEMGSGFFNIYREAEVIEIYSVLDGTIKISRDTPIRDERNRVIDISKEVVIGSASKYVSGTRYTKIKAVIPMDTEEKYLEYVSRIFYTTKNVIGCSQIPNIKFNGQDIHVERTLFAKFGFFEIYIIPEKAGDYESYFLTKGVPFAPLAGFFKDLLGPEVLEIIDRNMIVNIIHGGYTPVQTRTRINVKPEARKDFEDLAKYCVFLKMLSEIRDGRRSYALDHMYSQSDPAQLLFINSTIYKPEKYIRENSYLKYVEFMGQPGIANLINRCITQLKDKVLDVKLRTVFLQSNYNSPSEIVNEYVRYIVNKWFENKRIEPVAKPKASPKVKGATTKSSPGAGQGASPVVEDVLDRVMTDICQLWVNTFWKIAAQKLIPGYDASKVPKCIVKYSKKQKGIFGLYDTRTNVIMINSFFWDAKEREQIVKILKLKSVEKLKPLKSNKIWEQFFDYGFPCSTLPHELEHARRKNGHNAAGGHDSLTVSLFPGDTVQTRTYDQCANAVYQRVLANGFYEKFFA